ncbi:MAG TPA: polysaccharide deacetylase family protein [Blastocatellia bacterium]|nr:polysaccharide deacetylase family protein [Blastocatellia bacterium]
MSAGTVYLMYHEIAVPGRRLCQAEEGYARYVVAERDFREQIRMLRDKGYSGVSVTEALDRRPERGRGGRGRTVAITFDDGCQTDLVVAAPVLKEVGFNSTFYIVEGFINGRGYLTAGQVKELSRQGFEIGCHSMTHSYLTDLSHERLLVEIVVAKDRLEQLIGERVDHFSCPGGRWSPAVARLAQEAGYRTVTTSRVGINLAESDPYKLSRVAVMRDTTITDFDRICRAEGLLLKQARYATLAAVKGMLGNTVYERMRSKVLDRG